MHSRKMKGSGDKQVSRQIILDTETTGLEPSQGHRVIEIGCVELVNRRKTGKTFHVYLNPEREVEAGAIAVHGITNEFLTDKPLFRAIAEEFVAFIRGAELVIHNAPFDVGFINHELKRCKASVGELTTFCSVLDTLPLARKMHPGQKASLDALCKRYDIDNSKRQYHGALLDAEILADVYLAMTGGQITLGLGGESQAPGEAAAAVAIRRAAAGRPALPVIAASEDELAAHQAKLQVLQKESGGKCLWLTLGET
jgi:DNA polymerase III subunit epsilon